jgi:RNA polymerase sigma factor (sigma-70 family)
VSVPTRSSLLVRLRNLADEAGWQEFFDTYWQLIYGVALKAGLTAAEAEDVVQETLIAVAKKMPGFEYVGRRDSFRGWLLQITRWKIADQFRKRLPVAQRTATRTNGTRATDRIVDPAGKLDALWETEWQRHILAGALRRVKERVKGKQFQIYFLHVVKDWPVEKVARRLDVNAGQVYLVKHRIAGLVKREVGRLQQGAC